MLVDRGKAEVLERSFSLIHTPHRQFHRPSVIRLVYMIKRPRPKIKLSRREVFLRDGHVCQYCGTKTKDLTIDHVIPRHRGGNHAWENLVSACRPCNHRKGGKTLEEAKMSLSRLPYQPRAPRYYGLTQHLQSESEWRKFIPEWEVVAG